jgi:NAD(P)-dependent dehydrogenase (short-subunit alcohol dehydrogenase family)
MDLELQRKKVLITGASKGIGFGIASKLLGEGCELKLVARDVQGLQEAQDALIRNYPKGIIKIVAADLGDQGHLARVFEELRDIDILVNSAGSVPRGTLLETSSQSFRSSFDAKVMGTIDLCREAYTHMRKRHFGVILNIIGLSGEKPNPKSVATSTANAALIAFTQAVGCISPDDNIRVLGINPGLIATPRTAGLGSADDSPHHRAYTHLLSTLPFGRMGKPDEIADMVAFLVSARASYASGCVYTVDGGLHFRA